MIYAVIAAPSSRRIVRVREIKASQKSREARQRTHATNFFASCFLADLLFFSCFRADSLLTRTKDTKKTRIGGSAHIYKQEKKSFSFSCTRKKHVHSLYSHHGHYFNRDAVERDELLSAAKIVVVVEQTNLFGQKIHRLFECSKTSFRLVFEKGIRRCLGIFGQD